MSDDQVQEMCDGMPVPPPATEEEWDIYYAQEVARFSDEDRDLYCPRPGETAVQHCKRLSDYIFRNRGQ